MLISSDCFLLSYVHHHDHNMSYHRASPKLHYQFHYSVSPIEHLTSSIYLVFQEILYLQDNFTTVRQIHDKQTRQNTKTQLYVPKYKLDYGKRTFKYIGSTLWNGLPESLRNIKSIVLFKENYKSYIKPKVFKTSIFFSHQ